MNDNYIDLHVHSTYSDGTLTPSELVALAKEKQLAAFALTDHDSFDGIPEAREAAERAGIELVPGIEFSTEYHSKDIHILGLCIDTNNHYLNENIWNFKHSREIRNEKMANNLRNMGIDITIEAMQKKFGDSVMTRAHFSRFLYDNGYTKTLREAFEKYIGDNCEAFVPREKVTPNQAVSLILKAQGVPILAHPLLYHFTPQELDELTASLVKSGLMGIEAIYVNNTGFDEGMMRKLANKYSLLLSGGSDFHGENKPNIELGTGRGNLRIPYAILEKIKQAKERRLLA